MKVTVITRKQKEENFNSTASDIKLTGKKLKKQREKTFSEDNYIKRDRQGNLILWH